MNPAAPTDAVYDSWAEFYDLTDADHSACVSFYRSLVSPLMRSMLDLGCGTGINTCAIARAFDAPGSAAPKRFVALDNSARMLERARDRNPAIEWIQTDFRLAPVEGSFDFILCCFNTLQVISPADLGRLFPRVRELLSPGGVFAFDVYQPNMEYLRHPSKNRLAKITTTAEGRRLETREDALYDPEQRILSLTWRLMDSEMPEQPPLAHLSLEVHQHFPNDIAQVLSVSGLRMINRYGDFDRSDFTPGSRKQVIVCQATG